MFCSDIMHRRLKRLQVFDFTKNLKWIMSFLEFFYAFLALFGRKTHFFKNLSKKRLKIQKKMAEKSTDIGKNPQKRYRNRKNLPQQILETLESAPKRWNCSQKKLKNFVSVIEYFSRIPRIWTGFL